MLPARAARDLGVGRPALVAALRVGPVLLPTLLPAGPATVALSRQDWLDSWRSRGSPQTFAACVQRAAPLR